MTSQKKIQTLPGILSMMLMAGALLIANASPLVAQEAASTGSADNNSGQVQTQITPWNINCAGAANGTDFDCQMVRTMFVGNNRSLLMRMTLSLAASTDEPSLLLHLPHGVYLPDGVTLSLDNHRFSKEVVQTCDQTGCYVGLAADRAFLPSFQSSTSLKVSFQDLSRNTVTIEMPLAGFSNAYAHMTGN